MARTIAKNTGLGKQFFKSICSAGNESGGLHAEPAAFTVLILSSSESFLFVFIIIGVLNRKLHFATALAGHWIKGANVATERIELPVQFFAVNISLEGKRTGNAAHFAGGFDCDMAKSEKRLN